MCVGSAGVALGVGGLAASAVGSYRQVKAANMAADYNARIAEENAGIADQNASYQDYRAETIIRSGEQAQGIRQSQTNRMAGDQRTGFAASGVVVGSGSTVDAVADTMATGAQDRIAIKNNAAGDAYAARMDAYNLRQQANQLRTSATMTRKGKSSPWLAAGTSLLGGTTSLGKSLGWFG